MSVTTIRLDEGLRILIDREANLQGMTAAAYLRRAVVFYSGFVAGYRAGMFASGQDFPARVPVDEPEDGD